ncbi:MAG: FAD-dependent oxidoreductase [Rhodobacteraceae bacterium]|nr:FAD-dependent oxidoreductase [Paracoccaceae bacterium]
MTQHLSTEIAVVGAGVVGLAIAHRLAAAGREVLLIDPAAPGSGASYGNAGTIADYAVMPVGTPDVLRNLPALLFDRSSPLSIRRAAMLSLAPWLLRFLRQSLPGPAMRNATALAALLADATPRWIDLAAAIGAADILQSRGCLYLYETREAGRSAEAAMAARRGLGVTVDLIGPDELRQMEPGLPEMPGGAAFFPKAVFLNDPGRLMAALAQAAQTAGAGLLQAKAERLIRQVDGVALEGTGPEGTFHLHARRVVIAAGAHSRDLAQQAGDRVPLDTERGYHLEYDMVAPRLTRPACPTSRGFYLCPMAGRLRVAGTVELGGLTAPPSPHRLDRLEAGARAIFPDLPAPTRNWMGFRPSIPDSLPVIGPSRGGAEVLLAFGHGHIGLTLAPITAALIEGWIDGAPSDGFSAVLPTRF